MEVKHLMANSKQSFYDQLIIFQWIFLLIAVIRRVQFSIIYVLILIYSRLYFSVRSLLKSRCDQFTSCRERIIFEYSCKSIDDFFLF